MTTVSKMYDFPTGQLNLMYNYILTTGQLDNMTESERQARVIELVDAMGYPKYIQTRLAREMYASCVSGVEPSIPLRVHGQRSSIRTEWD